LEQKFGAFLQRRGYEAPDPMSGFEK